MNKIICFGSEQNDKCFENDEDIEFVKGSKIFCIKQYPIFNFHLLFHDLRVSLTVGIDIIVGERHIQPQRIVRVLAAERGPVSPNPIDVAVMHHEDGIARGIGIGHIRADVVMHVVVGSAFEDTLVAAAHRHPFGIEIVLHPRRMDRMIDGPAGAEGLLG